MPYRHVAAIVLWKASVARQTVLEKLPDLIDNERIVITGCFNMLKEIHRIGNGCFKDM